MPCYLICGLRVDADRALPGAIPLEATSTDVTVRAGRVPAKLENARRSRAFWEHSDEVFLWRMPGLGRFMARGGIELTMEADPGVDIEELLPFVMGTGVGALLYQRGGVVLHASAVAFEGRAYALCGASGAGKSTLAAALCAAGAEFLSDDVTQITLDASSLPVLNADGRSLKLTPQSIEALNLSDARQSPVRSKIEKYYVAPSRPGEEACVLGGVYFLDFDWRGAQPEIVPIARLNAAQRLLRETYRPHMALALMHGAGAPKVTAAVLKHADICSLKRPEGLKRLPEAVDGLIGRWRSATA